MGLKATNHQAPLLRLLIVLFLGPLLSCQEQKQPIGLVTTTNYCRGKIMASSKVVKPGDIALSHDIIKQYRLKFGDSIYVDDEPTPYVFLDKMPPQWHRRADLYSRNCQNAADYGVRKRMLWFVRKN